MEHPPEAGFSSPRDYGEYVFLGWVFVKNQKIFLKCSIIKFPFHEIPAAISGRAFYQGLF